MILTVPTARVSHYVVSNGHDSQLEPELEFFFWSDDALNNL